MEAIEKSFKCGFLITKIKFKKATIIEAHEFKSELDAEIQQGNHNIIIDLSSCEYIDSAFAGVLVLTLKKLKALGGKLRLVKPVYYSISVFHLNGTMELFDSYESVEDASGSLSLAIQEYGRWNVNIAY